MMTKGTANQRSREPDDASADQQGAEGGDPFVVWLPCITTKHDTLEKKKEKEKKNLSECINKGNLPNYCTLLYFLFFFLPEPKLKPFLAVS